MTFLEELQSHRGGILRIKSELYWYGGRGWDGAPGRVCLLLDAALAGHRAPDARGVCLGALASDTVTAVLLLIDGAPHWVWVAQEDVEIL